MNRLCQIIKISIKQLMMIPREIIANYWPGNGYKGHWIKQEHHDRYTKLIKKIVRDFTCSLALRRWEFIVGVLLYKRSWRKKKNWTFKKKMKLWLERKSLKFGLVCDVLSFALWSSLVVFSLLMVWGDPFIDHQLLPLEFDG